MSSRAKTLFALAVSAILVIQFGPKYAVAATKIEDFDATLIVALSGNLDGTTQRKIYSVGKLKPTWPIIFAASRFRGTSTAQANLNAAFLYDGSVLEGGLGPSILVQQFKPLKNLPAVLAIDFDEFELEASEKQQLQGFLFNNFVLSGTVAPGGYIKIIIKLSIEAEGNGTNVDRHVSITRTFTSDFEASASDIFGPNGILGVNLANKKIEELEISGIIRFDAMGTANGTTTLEVLGDD
jgi:hypothetical protein